MSGKPDMPQQKRLFFKIMSPKRSLLFVGFWVTTAILFAIGLYYWKGSETTIEFLTCYVIEWSLSLDNLFVFLMIFNAFGVAPHNQIRALEWGILGAVVMRLGFILIGVTLVKVFEPILYFFGALLLYNAYRIAFGAKGEKDVRQNRLVQLAGKVLRITKNYHGDKFFFHRHGRVIFTPMILVLITIESSDIMFAVDSIPAAFAITKKPFVIFTANMFAIFGLRSLYFLLAHADRMFSKLRYGVTIILAFVGVKIIVEQLGVHISMYLSLGVILVCILGSIAVSLAMKPPREEN